MHDNARRAYHLSVLLLLFITACSEKAPPYDPVAVIPSLEINVVAGNFQNATAETRLPDPIILRVTDSNQNPMQGVEITASILDGGGTLSQDTLMSDADGNFQLEWRLGEGPDYILKIALMDHEEYRADPVFLYANSPVHLESRWVSDIDIVIDGESLSHDNRIMESNHFLVFSDGSGDDVKMRLAVMAEATFHEVLTVFGFSKPAELGILSDETATKLKVYSNKSSGLQFGASANPRGYYVYALDSPFLEQAPLNVINNYRETIKHETTHLLQFLMGMPWANFPVIWFSEGIAELVSASRLFPPIETLAQYNQWWQVQGRLNPVGLNVISFYDLPEAAQNAAVYYPMFGLAVKYLLHDQGYGKDYADVKAMYYHMINTGTDFAEAFEIYFQLSVEDFESSFNTRMTDFLTQVGN